MVNFGGKKVGQVVAGIGGNGVGQVLAAVAVSLLFRLFTGPGPALVTDDDSAYGDDDERNDVAEAIGDGEAPVDGKVFPVTIRWQNITCSLSDKSSKSVCLFFFIPNL